jgi:DNA-binding response OmpR family regulator
MDERSVRKVLILDDDKALNRLVSLALRSARIETLQEYAPEPALEVLSQNPDLIIADMLLPGMDGLSFLAAARERGFEGPVLFLTALDETDARVRQVITVAGEDAIMTKPFDPDVLLHRVNMILDNGAHPR